MDKLISRKRVAEDAGVDADTSSAGMDKLISRKRLAEDAGVDADTSSAGLDKLSRKRVAEDAGVDAGIISQERKFKSIIHLVKTMMRETEEAHELDINLRERLTELEVLHRMKSPGFNPAEETSKVLKDIAKAEEDKENFKVTHIDWDELGYGNTE